MGAGLQASEVWFNKRLGGFWAIRVSWFIGFRISGLGFRGSGGWDDDGPHWVSASEYVLRLALS